MPKMLSGDHVSKTPTSEPNPSRIPESSYDKCLANTEKSYKVQTLEKLVFEIRRLKNLLWLSRDFHRHIYMVEIENAVEILNRNIWILEDLKGDACRAIDGEDEFFTPRSSMGSLHANDNEANVRTPIFNIPKEESLFVDCLIFEDRSELTIKGSEVTVRNFSLERSRTYTVLRNDFVDLKIRGDLAEQDPLNAIGKTSVNKNNVGNALSQIGRGKTFTVAKSTNALATLKSIAESEGGKSSPYTPDTHQESQSPESQTSDPEDKKVPPVPVKNTRPSNQKIISSKIPRFSGNKTASSPVCTTNLPLKPKALLGKSLSLSRTPLTKAAVVKPLPTTPVTQPARANKSCLKPLKSGDGKVLKRSNSLAMNKTPAKHNERSSDSIGISRSIKKPDKGHVQLGASRSAGQTPRIKKLAASSHQTLPNKQLGILTQKSSK